MKINKDWLVGFVDGEGCFFVGINKNPTMKTGFQVLPEFVIVQHIQDVQLLQAIRKYFDCGVVRHNQSKEDNIMMYRVRSLKSLTDIIIPFFEKTILLTKKKHDFIKFKKIIYLMNAQQHLTEEGLLEIKKIKKDMNVKRL